MDEKKPTPEPVPAASPKPVQKLHKNSPDMLATTELNKVPITIRSRCQLIRFERGSVKAIAKKLKSIVTSEKIEVEPEVLQLIAEHAEGGFRDAETLLESLTTGHQVLTLEAAQKSLGVVPSQIVSDLIETIFRGDQDKACALIKHQLETMSGNAERFTLQIIQQLREKRDNLEKSNNKERVSYQEINFALDQLLTAYILQKSTPIPSLPLEIACLTICEQQPAILGQVEEAPPAEKAISHVAVRPTPTPAPAAVAPVIELRQEEIKDIRKAWKLMVERVIPENLALAQSLKQTVIHTAEEGLLTIHVRYAFHADKMNEKKNYGRIIQLLKEITGQDWKVDYVVTSNVPRQRSSKMLESGLEEASEVFKS